MNTEKKIKGKSVTLAQKEALIEYMETNPELKKGKFNSTFTNKNAQDQWENISINLNAMIGATKTAEKWRKCWTDMKCNAKAKCVEQKKSISKTGGGISEAHISPLDEKIADIIGEIPIFGHPHTAEPLITFEGYDDIAIDSADNSHLLQPLVNKSTLPTESLSSPLNNFTVKTSKTVEISKDQGKRNYEEPVKLTSKKSKLDAFQKSVENSLQIRYASEERNIILKNYYAEKLKLLERITIAKEKKVALMEANMKFKE